MKNNNKKNIPLEQEALCFLGLFLPVVVTWWQLSLGWSCVIENGGGGHV